MCRMLGKSCQTRGGLRDPMEEQQASTWGQYGAWGSGRHLLLDEGLYQFPEAAVTKDHKLGGLKRQKCVLSPLWRPEV